MNPFTSIKSSTTRRFGSRRNGPGKTVKKRLCRGERYIHVYFPSAQAFFAAAIAAFLIEKETITGKEFMKILREIKGLPEPEEGSRESRLEEKKESPDRGALQETESSAAEAAEESEADCLPSGAPADSDTGDSGNVTVKESGADKKTDSEE